MTFMRAPHSDQPLRAPVGAPHQATTDHFTAGPINNKRIGFYKKSAQEL